MVILFFLFFLVFTQPVFADPTVSIIDFPESITAGNVFNVTFSVSAATPGLIYHYNIVGDGNSEFLTQPNTSCAGDYNTCENINIATDSANIATASGKINMVSGVYNFKINIAQSEIHSSTYNSDIVSITSILPTPSPTFTPTNTPEPTPFTNPTTTQIPTPTLTPTLISTSTPTPTLKPTVTLTATKTPTPISLLTPTAHPTDKNLYKLDESATASAIFTPTDESGFYTTPTISTTPFASNLVLGQTTTAKKNYLPLIFIVSGGLLLLSPLLFDKLKKK